MLEQFGKTDDFFARLPADKIRLTDPVGYLQMVLLESSCSLVLTDSGGVQKEAYFYEKPCVVLRSETEWIELVTSGAAMLADASEDKIVASAIGMLEAGFSAPSGFYGEGNSSGFIAENIIRNFRN
jgi:UDP-GlcNAc3NAcA epimerase